MHGIAVKVDQSLHLWLVRKISELCPQVGTSARSWHRKVNSHSLMSKPFTLASMQELFLNLSLLFPLVESITPHPSHRNIHAAIITQKISTKQLASVLRTDSFHVGVSGILRVVYV